MVRTSHIKDLLYLEEVLEIMKCVSEGGSFSSRSG